jgi:predicted short-subunit dehydrogenase-like oxidoreductase (DUF2520 family)
VADLDGLTFALVGAGRVGRSLARWLAAAGARATAVARRRPDSPATVLARDLGAAAVPLPELTSRGADLLVVAVADPALDAVAAVLAARPQAAVALHTAGGRGPSALAPLGRAGVATGTFHPLKAFPRALPDPAEARGVFFALAGDERAVALGRRIAAAWGATAEVVPEEARTLYHFAATLAAGGVTTLLAAAQGLADRLGLPAEVGEGYRRLALGALAAATPAAGGAPAAITGPAARGERATVEHQLGVLAEVAPELVPLAALLAREGLRRGAAAAAGAAGMDAELVRIAREFLDPLGSRC